MNLKISNFGPIEYADIKFGNLTFLIGPQASGKSLSLELLKLIVDKQHIISTLRNYNYILNKADAKNILDYYFGEGLSGLFRKDTSVVWNDCSFSPQDLLNTLSKQKASETYQESVFYVPAQRILTIADGRPKNFMEYDTSNPYVLRRFSETLRVFMQSGLGNPETIFPMKNRLKGEVKKSITDTIFHNGKVVLAIYCLSGPPTQVINKSDYRWVIIEEPEMGLHPRAIQSVLLEMIELVQNGYQVIVSTHSTTFLEFVWAFNNLKSIDTENFKRSMCEMFDIKVDTTAASLFEKLQDKSIKTYYSAKRGIAENVTFSDISTLDAFSEDKDISEWGGLSSFAGKSSEIVSRYGE